MSAKRKRQELEEINKKTKVQSDNITNLFYVDGSIEEEINKSEEPSDVLISVQMLFSIFKRVFILFY